MWGFRPESCAKFALSSNQAGSPTAGKRPQTGTKKTVQHQTEGLGCFRL